MVYTIYNIDTREDMMIAVIWVFTIKCQFLTINRQSIYVHRTCILEYSKFKGTKTIVCFPKYYIQISVMQIEQNKQVANRTILKWISC